jgi:hypothetical protein
MTALVILIWIAVWMVCGLAGYYISAEKGRGGFEGLLFGLFFGPFGLLLTVLMPEPERRVKPAWAFSSVMATIAVLLSVLIVIGLIQHNGAIVPPPAANPQQGAGP